MFIKELQYNFRYLKRRNFFLLISLIGCTIGAVIFLYLLIFIESELSFDKKNVPNDYQMFRVNTIIKERNENSHLAITSHELAPLLKSEFPSIVDFVRFYWIGEVTVKVEANQGISFFNESRVYRTDPSVLNVFPIKFIAGYPKNALDRNSVIISEKIAKKYFGDYKNALNKTITITIDKKDEYFNVSGVMENTSNNSHLKYDLLVGGIPDRGFYNADGTTSNSRLFAIDYVYTYLLFQKSFDPSDFDRNWDLFAKKYYAEESKSLGSTMSHDLTPLRDIHFNTLEYDLPGGNKVYLYSFIFLAILVLTITTLNHVNLATAKAESKFKAINIRKVLGASRKHLLIFLLFDSLFIVLVAYGLSMLIIYCVPGFLEFEQLIDVSLIHSMIFRLDFILSGLGIMVIIGILSGIYPAIYILQNTELKGNKNSRSTLTSRKTFVAIQFTGSMLVIILAYFISSQNEYLQHKNLGYNYKNILVLNLKNVSDKRSVEVFENELSKEHEIEDITSGNYVPGNPINMNGYRLFGNSDDAWKSIYNIQVSPNYFKVFDMPFVESDKFVGLKNQGLVLNESAAKLLNVKERTTHPLEYISNNGVALTIDGVVKDFNFRSLHNSIEPLIISVNNSISDYVFIKFRFPFRQDLFNKISASWKRVLPSSPFEATLYEDKLYQLYQPEFSRQSLLDTISVIGMIISFIGLIGVVSLLVKVKEKQMMIRKVLGATYSELTALFVKDMLLPSGIASLVAVPVAYYLFNIWIEGYAYKIAFDFLPPLIIGAGLNLLVILIVIFISKKLVTENPSNLLKE